MPRRTALNPDNTVTTTLRVRYAEVDQMRVAYYANYLVWFEVARGAFCRERGIDYVQMETDGLFLPVMDARIRYHSFARYDDELQIAINLDEQTRRTIRFGYRITCGERLVAEGNTVQMLVDAAGKSRSFPKEIASKFDGETQTDSSSDL